ncbi:helix-turn-helix domain-containing protein [Tissierellaceae bacterium HCP3S3_D8]
MDKKNKNLNFKNIGTRIRSEREKLGLSREKFAEIVGLSTYYIGQIERGDRNMSLETLFKISESLNISVDYILKGHIQYMENILALEAVEDNYKEEIDVNIKELLSLLSGTSRKNIELIKEITKLLLPYVNRN